MTQSQECTYPDKNAVAYLPTVTVENCEIYLNSSIPTRKLLHFIIFLIDMTADEKPQ